MLFTFSLQGKCYSKFPAQDFEEVHSLKQHPFPSLQKSESTPDLAICGILLDSDCPGNGDQNVRLALVGT